LAHNDFASEAGGYDPDEIMNRSQDHHGHSTNQRVYIQPAWKAIMEQVSQSDQWPEYRAYQDIVRDALYHRLHWISKQKSRGTFPYVESAMVRARYLKRLETDAEYEAEIRGFREKVDRELSEKLQREEYDSVQSYVEDLLNDMEHFKGREQEKLTNMVHTYLERAKGRW
jgi:hypothetical protein